MLHACLLLLDFGLSEEVEADGMLTFQCGNPAYAAPELYIPFLRYGPEVDTWSL